MFGKYSDSIQGQVYGLGNGIDKKKHLWEAIYREKHNEWVNTPDSERYDDKGDIEYLAGIRVGFSKIEKIREKLLQGNERLKYKKKVQLFKYLVEKHIDNHAMFEETLNGFLENMENWDATNIPIEVYKDVQFLLQEKKIQRAINRVYDFNHEEFRLKSIIEFAPVKFSLWDIRNQKRLSEINIEQLRKGKIRIGNNLIKWIEKRLG